MKRNMRNSVIEINSVNICLEGGTDLSSNCINPYN